MTKVTAAWRETTPEVRHEIVKWCLQAFLGMIGYGLLLFLSAGSFTWIWGWAQMAILTGFMAAHPLLLIPINPELLAEREQGMRSPDVKGWDRWLAPLAAGGLFPMMVVAGLDVRFEWTGSIFPAAHVAGLICNVLGYALFLWAMVSNAFFSEGVRIQEERGHTVATGGPYRYVRHPGYAGAIVAALATPLLLGSMWAMIPASISAALYVLRTALEDKTLIQELPGYRDYAQQTRFRLVPGLW
jgi:protein-S-isoprenylcysteine O-methyltransferase Ste14